ncbi:oxidoreductase, short chain dehydrogenase/reductase family [Stemphylium lycopersici]|nr:oxidoreductase, short chain dehydrogenase/reductase family [Stemphylium lycopersici]
MSPSAIEAVTSALAPNTTQSSSTQTPAMFSLAGKTIAITGGGRGLGITLAGAVIEAGGHAACMDILPEPSKVEWEALQKLAKQVGTTATYRKCDVTSEADVTQVLDEISQDGDAHGAPLNGMVACAGIQQRVPALDYEASDFERMLRVNVVGAFISVKRTARILKDKGVGGSIVLIASMSGQVANRGLTCTAYNSSKSAVHQMCRSLAQEWGQYGIRVNTLSPGYIRTAMTDELLTADPEVEKIWMAAYKLPPCSSNNGSLESLPSYSNTDLPPVYTTHAHTIPYASSWAIDLEAQPRANFPTGAPRIRALEMVHCSSRNPFASTVESISLGEAPAATPTAKTNRLHAALKQSTIRRNQQRAEFSRRDRGQTYRHLSCYGFIAGTVVGVFSLSIQLFEKLSNYTNSVKDARYKAEQITHELDNLLSLLENLESVLGRIQDASSAVWMQVGIQECSHAIKTIRAKLGDDTQTASSSRLWNRLRKVVKRLAYPFKETDINYWQDVLKSVRHNLQIALLTLNTDQQQQRFSALQLQIEQFSLRTETGIQKLLDQQRTLSVPHRRYLGKLNPTSNSECFAVPEFPVFGQNQMIDDKRSDYLAQILLPISAVDLDFWDICLYLWHYKLTAVECNGWLWGCKHLRSAGLSYAQGHRPYYPYFGNILFQAVRSGSSDMVKYWLDVRKIAAAEDLAYIGDLESVVAFAIAMRSQQVIMKILVTHLVDQRRWLQQAVERYGSQCSCVFKSAGILDVHASCALRVLDEEFDVPPSIRPTRRSIYHERFLYCMPFAHPNYDPARDLQMLYESGFTDVGGKYLECNRDAWCPPLIYGIIASSSSIQATLDTADWFLSKGAKWNEVWPGSRTAASHCLGDAVGRLFPKESFKDEVASVLQHNIHDDCACHCSTHGCTSATSFLKSSYAQTEDLVDLGVVYPKHNTSTIRSYYLTRFDRNIACVSLATQDAQHKWILSEFIRLCVFVMLGIRHICCNLDKIIMPFGEPDFTRQPLPRYSPEELQTIAEEDAHLISILEEMVPRFDKQCDEHDGDLRSFVDDVLIPEMIIVLERLKKEDETEYAAGRREVGVVMYE